MANKKAKGIDALAKAREHYENGNSCGDPIAKALESFRTRNGLDTKALTRCLKENGIEAPNVDMDRHGAIGRFRMCAGLMLRGQATKTGFVLIGRIRFSHRRLTSPMESENGRGAELRAALARPAQG